MIGAATSSAPGLTPPSSDKLMRSGMARLLFLGRPMATSNGSKKPSHATVRVSSTKWKEVSVPKTRMVSVASPKSMATLPSDS
jgi:hypothetical protein